MTKLEKVATMRNCNFMGGWCFLNHCKNNLQKTLTKANMFVKLRYISIVKFMVSDTQDLLQTKFKVLALIRF